MSITTEHRYISDYQIKSTSKYLIIGTIHPHRTEDFEIDFFYGNRNSFWTILSDAFPNKDFSNKENIVNTLDINKTAITDIIKKCDREDVTKTKDKDLFNICLNTNQIKNGIKNSSISTIYFTSRFGKNNAAKLFVENFKIRYKDTWNEETSSFLIPEEIFGREIKAIVLFSPSGQANTGISQSESYKKKKHLYKDKKTPVKEFRKDFYKEKFDYLNE